MKELPSNVEFYRRTPEFTETSVPKGLLRSHSTKPGTWGKIVVVEGALRYRIVEPDIEEHTLEPGDCGIVEPTIRHEVQPQHKVRFFVEFYRKPDT